MNNGEHPLVKERRQRNLTQKDLAARTRLSARTIWCAENSISISLDSRKRICTYLKKTAEELGLNASDPDKAWGQGAMEDSTIVGGSIVGQFDETKRDTLRMMAGLTAGAYLTGTREQPAEAKGANESVDLDMINDYTGALHKLFEKGESSYVLQQSQRWYDKLEPRQRQSQDIRLAELSMRLGMLMCAAQQYILPWYQRDQTVIHTYNHIEESIFQKFPLKGSLVSAYAQLLAKRGRHYRVLWQFDASIKECEHGLTLAKAADNFPLYTHFLCERAHIEVTCGNETGWLQKLEEARRGVLGNENQAKALNQIDYMQGEGYKRLAFHAQKTLSFATRERYANVALSRLNQWDGATIEIPSYESLVIQTSKAQCMIFTDPESALRLTDQLRKPAEQHFPTLLDKIYRVEFLAHQRLQTNKNAFLRTLHTSVYRAGKNVI
ncbi:helix-turn-helix domain-containing protein [Dictyobacter kobayashii]|uniref:HTH cro/C1-type domain-containing protein n=1 Tax=Dictyobacter kobayashii TaxID=2014872 RepID=A0A402ACD9_9CHLR|nr:helix-turn-helix transcriptional regulator [Dictyobacter kobayashii]GCE16748.1 hypothetical protein KDK_05480 [Dictyobacter kobayashii]